MFLRHVVGLSGKEIDDLTVWEIENYPWRWFATKVEVFTAFMGFFMGSEKIETEEIEKPKEKEAKLYH